MNIKWSYSKANLNLFWVIVLIHGLILVSTKSSVLAQSLTVKTEIDTNELLIGDQVMMVLSAQFPEDKTLLWPQIGDTLIKEIEVVSRSMDDTTSEKGAKTINVKRTYTITSFDSGYFIIPPFAFSLLEDSLSQVFAEPLLIAVKTIEVDTAMAYKDIKDPFDVPYTLTEFIPHIIIGSIVLLALLIGYLLYNKLKSREKLPVEKIAPVIPPHIIALDALNVLKDKEIWQKGEVKLYYVGLTEITRIYIENRFNVIAMELTTDEIISSMSFISISDNSKKTLSHMLRLADMVKFAKYKPIASEHELCMKNAFDFVNETKQEIGDLSQDNTNAELDNLPQS